MIPRSLAPWLGRNEARLTRRLRQGVVGLLITSVAVANPATLPSSDALARSPSTASLAVPRTSTVYDGTDEPGRAGVEESARRLVGFVGGLATGDGGAAIWLRSGDLGVTADRCPRNDLVVSWSAPEGTYVDGAYIEPLGPTPTDATRRVNGVVLCRSSRHAFLGFEAEWTGGRWQLVAVPSLAEETEGPLLEGEAATEGPAPAEPVVDDAGAPTLPPAAGWAGTPLEPRAPYVPQTTCDPVAKPGVLGFRDLLLAAFPGSRNLGIGRVCEAAGVSEHKEGRAFDWGVHADDPTELAAAEAVLSWMLGPDETGEPDAIARRLGLMYVIWDGRIWSSFLAEEGWRPYVGRSPHRDHIHFSFDWNGALAQSSFWRDGRAGLTPGSERPDLPLGGVVPLTTTPQVPLPVPELPLPPPPALPSRTEPAPARTSSPSPSTTTSAPPPQSTTTTTTPPPTTSTTAPFTPTLPTPPTTIRLGSL